MPRLRADGEKPANAEDGRRKPQSSPETDEEWKNDETFENLDPQKF